MQPLFEYRLSLAGYQTRALELEGEGPAILLLHGYADSADTWRLALDLLARSGRRTLALDLPGFGTASPLRSKRPVLEQLDRFAAAAVKRLTAEAGPVLVAGNSLGGCVALRLAQREELGLAAVAPIAPAGLDMARWLAVIERDPIVRALLALPFPLPEPVVRTAVGEVYRTLVFARPRAVAAEVVRAFTEHHRDRASLARNLATARRLLPELRDPFELERVSCPVLLVWGDRDRLVTHLGAQRVTEAIPDARYELLAGCGHCPQIEEPRRFVELLVEFSQSDRVSDRIAGLRRLSRPA